MGEIDELLSSLGKGWDLKLIAKNKDSINFLIDNKHEAFPRFFDETYLAWNFYPGLKQVRDVFNLKLSELKKLSGCSSCMINSLKNETYSPVARNLNIARDILQIIDNNSK